MLNVSGDVWVKVQDTDRKRGARILDSLHIREVLIEWSDISIDTAPSQLTAQALSYSQIELQWVDGLGESAYQIEQLDGGLWSPIAQQPSDSVSYEVSGLTADTLYSFRVCNVDLDQASGCSNLASVTTFPQGSEAPVLNFATGYKVKGRQFVDLNWDHNAAVVIYRDGEVIFTSSANQSDYTDSLNIKGGGRYLYKVCDLEFSLCSNTLSVIF